MSFARVETAIHARLLSHGPAVRSRLTAENLAGLEAQAVQAPALAVMLQDYQVTDSRSDGAMAQVQQVWLVMAIVKSIKPDGAAGRQSAGSLLDAVASALMGWQPEGAASPLRLASAPAPLYQDGLAYMALAFTVETFLKGNPQ